MTLASELKRKQKRGVAHRLLAGKGLALVFEKPSLRTRATFAVGMTQLGGEAVYLGPAEVGLGTRETPADCARNLDRWFDLITVRTFAHKIIEEMAEHSSVPVINALTDDFHPCQVLADCQTLIEHKGELGGLKIAFVGDGNNMVQSWLEAAAIVPFSFALACPKGYEPDGAILKTSGKCRREDHSDPLCRRSCFARGRDLYRCVDQHGPGERNADALKCVPPLPGE